jgi:hypothetical protein
MDGKLWDTYLANNVERMKFGFAELTLVGRVPGITR